MSDEQTPRSGSRWEPADPPPVTAPRAEEAGPGKPRRRSWRDRAGDRGWGLGLGALALVLVGGLGGAAVAHTVAGDVGGPDASWVQQSGVPGADHPDADEPDAGQPGLQQPLGPDAGRAPAWGDDDAEDLDDAEAAEGADDADEHETHADLGEHEDAEVAT